MMPNQPSRKQSLPMPKGYGMVKLPHFLWQPGFVVFGAVSMFFGVIEAWVQINNVDVVTESKSRSHGRCMFEIGRAHV